MTRIIDLSHTVAHGTVTYPGLPAPVISDHLSREASRAKYAAGTTFQIGRIDMIANTGTYIDAPSHRWEGREDVALLPLERVANLEGVVVDGTALDSREVRNRAVLFRTGWSRHFGTAQYGSGHPFLTRDTARALINGGAALVGIDSLNIDDATDAERPVHTMLLDRGIPIVEHLTALDQLPGDGFRFFATPAKVAGMGSFIVRAFAII
jgi:kynurenine formamidase